VVVACEVDEGIDFDEEALAVGEAAAAPFFFFNHECLDGDGLAAEAADAPGLVAAVAAIFFECLCLPGDGEAPGVGDALCAIAEAIENTINAVARGKNFFMSLTYHQAWPCINP
jgi:hypothetical protein